MFLAPVLYALHAVATGLAMVIMNLFGVRLGFSFSAGLFDYVLNFSHAQRPLLLLPIGAVYFVLYYAVFRAAIVRLNLQTPGREAEESVTEPAGEAAQGGIPEAFVTALGGASNISEVAACTTRLRLVLADNKAINEAMLKRLGARGIVRSSERGLQVVLGPVADQVAGEIRARLRQAGPAAARMPATVPAAIDAPGLLAALGGRANILELAAFANRLLIRAAQPDKIDAPALARLGIRGVARSAVDGIQVLVSDPAEVWAEPLRRLL
jgi:PTS system N-acetylglucosamine-specific IIC component